MHYAKQNQWRLPLARLSSFQRGTGMNAGADGMSSSTALVAGGNFTVGEALATGAAWNDPSIGAAGSADGNAGPVGGLALTLFGNGAGDFGIESDAVGNGGNGGGATGVIGGATNVGVANAGSGAGSGAGAAAVGEAGGAVGAGVAGAVVGAGFEAGTTAGADAGVGAGIMAGAGAGVDAGGAGEGVEAAAGITWAEIVGVAGVTGSDCINTYCGPFGVLTSMYVG